MSMRVYGEGPGAQLLVMTKLFSEPGPCPAPGAVTTGLAVCAPTRCGRSLCLCPAPSSLRPPYPSVQRAWVTSRRSALELRL